MEYGSFYIGLTIVLIIAEAGAQGYQNSHFGQDPVMPDNEAALTGLAIVCLVIMPWISLKVRCYHDFDGSGWAVLWAVVPLANIFFELMLLFRRPSYSAHDQSEEREPSNINIYNAPGAGRYDGGPTHGDHVDQISRLADMHAQGVLTSDEFAEAKARILRH